MESTALCETLSAPHVDRDISQADPEMVLKVNAMRTTKQPALTRLASVIRAHVLHSVGWSTLLALPGAALAGPTGEQLVAGNAAVARPDSLTTQIDQTSDRAVLNWQSFSVGDQEYVRFAQPDAASVILNRVVGGNESQILGRLDANGRVFLVNPQGVYFGPGAQVDASGFAASALDIRDQDFMAGRYVFAKGAGTASAQVVNEGRISADQFVVLMGDRAANEGLIAARLGTVVLAAGSATTLQLDDTDLVNFAVDEKTTAAIAGVENTGQIVADGGQVLMTAKVADGLVATAVNNSGLVRARRIDETGGEIFLRASGGDIQHSGTLDAAGSGGHAGGRIIVKGDQDVVLENGSKVIATGEGAAGGGTVRLIADNKLTVRAGADVDVQGGARSVAAGGNLELSGHQSMSVAGNIQIGAGGQLLIDPSRLQIISGNSSPCGSGGSCSGLSNTTIGAGYIESLLFDDIDVTLIASDEIFTSTPLTINSGTGTGNLTLAIGSVSSAGSFGSLTGPSSDGSPSFFLCHGLGACVPGSDGFFEPGSFGDIHVENLDINIRGDFFAVGGLDGGEVMLGNVSARQIGIINGSSGSSSSSSNIPTFGKVQANNLFASGNGFGGIVVLGNEIKLNNLTVLNDNESPAFLFVAGQRIEVTGNITVAADEALASFNATDRIELKGVVNVQGQTAGRVSMTAGNGIIVRNLVHAAGDFSVITAGIEGADGGAILTQDNGLLQAKSVGLGWDPDGLAEGGTTPPVDIDVRTDAKEIFIGLFDRGSSSSRGFSSGSGSSSSQHFAAVGNGALNVALDNRAHAGSTDIIMQNGFFERGEFGSSVDGYIGFFTRYQVVNDGINLGSVKLNMNGNTFVSGEFSARNLAVNAENGVVLFTDHVSVGDLPLPPEFGDRVVLNAFTNTADLAGNGAGVPRFEGFTEVGPNAVFRAQSGIFFADGIHFSDPDVPYVIFQTDGPLDFGPGVTADPHEDFLAQFTTFTAANDIVVEDSPASGAGNFFNSLHFSKLPGTTIVLGSESLPTGAHLGNILVGEGGPIDIGAQNIAFATQGQARISPNFTTRGRVGQLKFFGGKAFFESPSQTLLDEKFEVPIASEFDLNEQTDEAEDEEQHVDLDDVGDDESEQLVSQQSNTGQMCE